MNRILRALTSEPQPCGCLVGVYETYDAEVVRLVDFKAESCGEHRQDQTVFPPGTGTHTPSADSEARDSS